MRFSITCCHFEHLKAASCPFDWEDFCRTSLTTASKDMTRSIALSFDMLYHQESGSLGLPCVSGLLFPSPAIAATHSCIRHLQERINGAH
jgi:hypothetical protein